MPKLRALKQGQDHANPISESQDNCVQSSGKNPQTWSVLTAPPETSWISRLSHDVAFSKFSTFFIHCIVKCDVDRLIQRLTKFVCVAILYAWDQLICNGCPWDVMWCTSADSASEIVYELWMQVSWEPLIGFAQSYPCLEVPVLC